MTDLKRYRLDCADGEWTPYDEAERALLDARAERDRLRAYAQVEPSWNNMTDWSNLPDVYVTNVKCQDGIVWRIEACSVPMAIGPEVRLVLADKARADAQAAVALALEEAAENKEQLDIWAQEILEGLSFADVLKITSYDDKIEAHDMVGRGLVEVIRALAPADGLAAVEALRVEARENAMQALASMGQAQEAYEAQLEAEAERDRLRDRERVLADFIAEFAAAKIDALRYQPAYGESPEDAPDPVVEAETVWAWQEDARAALAQTPTDPGDGWTWNERLGWIGPDGKPAARGGA